MTTKNPNDAVNGEIPPIGAGAEKLIQSTLNIYREYSDIAITREQGINLMDNAAVLARALRVAVDTLSKFPTCDDNWVIEESAIALARIEQICSGTQPEARM